MTSKFSIPTIRRINDPNAPEDSIVVQTTIGSRVAIKKVQYNRLKNLILNAVAEHEKTGVHRQVGYQQFVSDNPWAVLVFPLLWKDMPEIMEMYTDYDPTDVENCVDQIEDIAIKILTAKVKKVGG